MALGRLACVGFRKGANKFGRNTFQQLARGSIKSSSWARKQFVKKRNEGKGSHHAFRCLANTWVKITFAMWCSKMPYDETRQLASIASHIINQPAFCWCLTLYLHYHPVVSDKNFIPEDFTSLLQFAPGITEDCSTVMGKTKSAEAFS